MRKALRHMIQLSAGIKIISVSRAFTKSSSVFIGKLYEKPLSYTHSVNSQKTKCELEIFP